VGDAYRNTAYDPENRYSVHYTWGTVGVIYNTKFVDEADTGSWDLLWNEKYKGKILMFDNPRDAFGIAEAYLGLDVNSESSADLGAAAELLLAQHPLLQDYVMDQIFDKMEHEEAWVAPYYAGDYLLMAEENEALAFYFPKEGFNLFIDAMCVPKNSEHQAEAEAYINFLCSPEISGENLEYLGYSTPIEGAREYMDPETAESEIAYPPESVLSNGFAYMALSTEATQEMDSLWLKVKTSGGSKALLIGVIGLAVVAAAAVILLLLRKSRKAKRKNLYTK
jgi:spermidine/putrescine transport system substrate-binding protein